MRSETLFAALQAIAPLELAESWDNVGVLIESGPLDVQRVLLTIDLTEEVLEEAIQSATDVIVAYHPPIFSGLQRIVASETVGRIVTGLLTHNITTYSPHTALDAAPGGINDWLAAAFPAASTRAIVPCPGPHSDTLFGGQPVGQGRTVLLKEELTLDETVVLLKQYLGLSHLRLSRASIHEHAPVTRVAVCAGSGGSVVMRDDADLYVTGEMRHHDVLASKAKGTSVILTEHTNSERGYLPSLQAAIMRRCPDLTINISTRDRDPLAVV